VLVRKFLFLVWYFCGSITSTNGCVCFMLFLLVE